MAKLKRTILVVDDDVDARTILSRILEEEGYAVIQAADGRDALQCLSERPVDLIVTDRAMPNMDGMEFLSALQEKKISTPVLMVSGYGEESLWGQAISRGAKDYLLKPFKSEDVLTQIRKYLPKKPLA